MDESRANRLKEFQGWTHTHIKGDEKGEAQIFLDRLFQAFGQKGCLEVAHKIERGLPATYPHPDRLATTGCIQPPIRIG